MKITAHFYSPDEADHAAAAVMRLGNGIFDVNVTSDGPAPRRGDTVPVGIFTNINTGNAQAVAVSAGGVNGTPHEGGRTTLEVICRPSEAHRVTSALVSRGGHGIRKT